MAVSAPAPFVRPEATTWSVEDILRRAKEGQLHIPAFQRVFRWKADDVRKLFDSIYRGYPIGDLLLWETEQTAGTTTTFGPVSFQASKGRGYVIIDGQQRITSLVAVLLRSEMQEAKDARFQLFFDLKVGNFVHMPRGREVPPTEWLPLPDVADTMRFLEWLQSRTLSEEHVRAANLLVRSLRDYRVPVYVVHTTDEEQIREIFERLNTTGKRLTATEIFGALKRGSKGTDLNALAKDIKELGFGALEEEWLLKATAAVINIDVTRNLGEALRKVATDEVRRGISEAERAIIRVIRFLREDVGVPHIELLPYRFPLVPLTKFFHLIRNPSEDARRRLAAWVWQGVWSEQHVRSDAPTIRAALASITENEGATVSALLNKTSVPTEHFKLRNHDFRAAGTKLTCAVLASMRPQNLQTGEVMDVAALIEKRGADAFRPIIHRGGEETRGTENRLMHDDVERSTRDVILQATEDALASHCIPPESLHALVQGRDKLFLELRREALEYAVNKFLEARV